MKKNSFNSPMIQRLTPQINNDSNSKIVYHYTSPEAFLNIITGKNIRFSDILFMNDNSEKKYVVKKLIEFCEDKKDQFPFFDEAVSTLIKNNNINEQHHK